MKRKFIPYIISCLIIFCCTTEDTNTNDPSGNGNGGDNGNGNGNGNTTNVDLNRQAVGSSANDLLSDNTFTSMLIEVVYVEGFEPSQAALNNFRSFVESRTFKSNGVTIAARAITSPNTAPYSIDEIRAIEIENRQNYNTDNQIAVWVFFADGNSENDTNNGAILGTAYWNTSFVIYEETIQNFSDNILEPDRVVLETTVINHEFGHILGLTNLGTPMQQDHEDDAHPRHCDVDTCLMFWSAETSSGLDSIAGMDSAPDLDAQCIADLQANGGR